jgi:hypothetical protein
MFMALPIRTSQHLLAKPISAFARYPGFYQTYSALAASVGYCLLVRTLGLVYLVLAARTGSFVFQAYLFDA